MSSEDLIFPSKNFLNVRSAEQQQQRGCLSKPIKDQMSKKNKEQSSSLSSSLALHSVFEVKWPGNCLSHFQDPFSMCMKNR